MDEKAGISERQADCIATRPSWSLVAISVLSIALCLWFAGWLVALATTLSAREGAAIGFLAALLGPGLVAAQQYLGTFRTSTFGARFCTWFFGVTAVFAGLPLITLGNQLYRGQSIGAEAVTAFGPFVGVSVFAAISSLLNYCRWSKLVQAERALLPRHKSRRVTLLEVMAIMLGFSLVLGGAALFSHQQASPN